MPASHITQATEFAKPLMDPLVAFGADPIHINTWILHFPYSLLPLLLVSFAVLGHIVLSRKLSARQSEATLASRMVQSPKKLIAP
jgi:hypothetical protein